MSDEKRMSTCSRCGKETHRLPFHTCVAKPRQSEIRFCDRKHNIKEKPRDTYLERYPKAVAVWVKGRRQKWLCENCGKTFERLYGFKRDPMLITPNCQEEARRK